MSKAKMILFAAAIMITGSAWNVSAMMGGYGSRSGDHMTQETYWRGEHMDTGARVYAYYAGPQGHLSVRDMDAVHHGHYPRSDFRTRHRVYHYGNRSYIGNQQKSYHYNQYRRHYNER